MRPFFCEAGQSPEAQSLSFRSGWPAGRPVGRFQTPYKPPVRVAMVEMGEGCGSIPASGQYDWPLGPYACS